MGYDLYNKDGKYLDMNILGWERFLGKLTRRGWQPVGTVYFDHENGELRQDWSGSYCSNDGQLITEEECRSIARIIIREKMRGKEFLLEENGGASHPSGDAFLDFQSLATERPDLANDYLISFFMNGPVRIW